MDTRTHRYVARTAGLALIGLLATGGTPADEPATEPPQSDASEPDRYEEYRVARARAKDWVDRLQVDAVELQKHEVKGKKKLSEILELYWLLYRRTADQADRATIVDRARQLTEQTRQPAYHNMGDCPGPELNENSMAYLQIAWQMEQFGLDNSAYLKEIHKAKPRLDRHLGQVNRFANNTLIFVPWQRVLFRNLYGYLGLETTPVLSGAELGAGVIGRRLALASYREWQFSQLTHEVLAAFEWGRAEQQDSFDAETLEYIKRLAARFVSISIERDDPEMAASVVASMAYLGWRDDPFCVAGVNYLLETQNENGSWGKYENYRRRYGANLDAHLYLHTTMVAIRALSAAFDGEWKPAGSPE